MLVKFMEILVSQGVSQGGSFSARPRDLACPGVAPPLAAKEKYTVRAVRPSQETRLSGCARTTGRANGDLVDVRTWRAE